MGIINRDLSRSEKRKSQAAVFGALATGVTQLISIIPSNSIVTGMNVSAFGISGSPVWSLSAFRFNATGGLTSINMGFTLSVGTIGTSGNLGASFASPGISLIAGDVIALTTGGANSSVTNSAVTLYYVPLADINVYQNSGT